MIRTHVIAGALICGLTSVLAAQDQVAAEKVTYNDHVLPIFRARCGSCHNANDKKGGLVIDDYAALMEGGSSGTVVEGGDADASYLWLLVNHESEPKMPPNSAKLPDNELAVIRNWIAGGLLQTAGSTAMIKPKSAVTKIEVSGERPTEVAMPVEYLGDPAIVPEEPSAVTALACSPWAPLAAVSGYQQVSVYNTQDMKLLGVLAFPEGQPQIIKFSRNGSLLAVGGGHGGASGKVVVFDVATGARVAEVGNEYDEVLAADISPDHAQIALGGPKKMLRVYSVATGELMYETKKHTDWVTAIEFSPDGVLLASADRANGLVIWEAHSGQVFHDLTGHSGAVTDVSWRSDSNVLASASEDGTIRLWEINNGGQIKSWNAHGGVLAMDYLRDGRLVSTGRDHRVRLWNADGGQIREFAGTDAEPMELGMEVAFDGENERVLAGDWAGRIRIWNAADGALLQTLTTNPPNLAMTIGSLVQHQDAVESAAVQTSEQLAALQAPIAQRDVAAQAAVAQSTQATQQLTAAQEAKAAQDKMLAEATAAKTDADAKLAAATTAKDNADKLVAEKAAAVKAAEEALAAAQAAMAAATKDREAAVATVAAATTTVNDSTTKVQAAQSAVDEAAKSVASAQQRAEELKQAAAAAQEQAKPTAEEQQAIAAAQAAADAARAKLETLKQALKQIRALTDQAQTVIE